MFFLIKVVQYLFSINFNTGIQTNRETMQKQNCKPLMGLLVLLLIK